MIYGGLDCMPAACLSASHSTAMTWVVPLRPAASAQLCGWPPVAVDVHDYHWATGPRFVYHVRSGREYFGVQFISIFILQLVKWVPPAVMIPNQASALTPGDYVSKVLGFALFFWLRRRLLKFVYKKSSNWLLCLSASLPKDWSTEIKIIPLNFRRSAKPAKEPWSPVQSTDKKRLLVFLTHRLEMWGLHFAYPLLRTTHGHPMSTWAVPLQLSPTTPMPFQLQCPNSCCTRRRSLFPVSLQKHSWVFRKYFTPCLLTMIQIAFRRSEKYWGEGILLREFPVLKPSWKMSL